MKVRNLNDAVLSVNGKLYCAFCGTEISSIENGCSCNRWNYVKANMPTVEGYLSKVDDYKNRAEALLATMPETKVHIESVKVIVPDTEPPAEGGGEGNGEPTEGGGE